MKTRNILRGNRAPVEPAYIPPPMEKRIGLTLCKHKYRRTKVGSDSDKEGTYWAWACTCGREL